MGDFNIDLLKFGTHTKTNDFIDSIVSEGLLPHITRPTRIGNNSATLIDHIYSNDCTRRTGSGIILTDISDHFGIFHIVKEKFKYQHPGNVESRPMGKKIMGIYYQLLIILLYTLQPVQILHTADL